MLNVLAYLIPTAHASTYSATDVAEITGSLTDTLWSVMTDVIVPLLGVGLLISAVFFGYRFIKGFLTRKRR